jgi:type II secretory pathway pseudopilin PulG
MNRRRSAGYTLIELVATIGLTSAVLTLLAAWLTTTVHNHRRAAEHLQQISSQDRLASQFRQDVRAAREALAIDRPLEPDVRLRLDLGDAKEVTYVALARMVERVERIGDEVVHREQYAVSPKDVHVEVNETQPPALALVIAQSSSAEGGTADLRIEANLGSDRRFAKGGRDED